MTLPIWGRLNSRALGMLYNAAVVLFIVVCSRNRHFYALFVEPFIDRGSLVDSFKARIKSVVSRISVAVSGGNPSRWKAAFSNGAVLLVSLSLVSVAIKVSISILVALVPRLFGSSIVLEFCWFFVACILVMVCAIGVYALVYTILNLIRAVDTAPGEFPVLSKLEYATANELERIIQIAHLTDLHLTSSPTAKRAEGGVGGNRALTRLIEKHASTLEESADIILITGDITDSGHPLEWNQFFQIWPEELVSRTVLVPGNHDINILHPSNYLIEELEHYPARRLRQFRMLSAIDLVQGTRSFVAPSITVRQVVRGNLELMREEARSLREGWLDDCPIAKTWTSVFPMAVEFADLRTVVLVFDSCKPSRHILSNAFGEISPRQLRRLKDLHQEYRGWNVVHALHHHIALPNPSLFEPYKYLQTRMMVLENTADLVQSLGAERKTLVFHGHRHFGFEGQLGNIQVVSGASTTLGDEGAPHTVPRVRVYEAAETPEGLVLRGHRDFD